LEKVSDSIIAQIRDSILSGKLKPGDRLASEKELTEQFGVSKATMREALRVLEVMGLIGIRKGISGGAFVAEVDMRTTIHSIVNFMHFQSVSIREITMLRYLIEPTVAQIAATRLTEKDVRNLKRLLYEDITSGETEVSKEISFHRYLARMSENTILVLTIDFIDNLLRSMKSKLNLSPDFYETVRKAHELILECLIQGDSVAAGVAMSNDLLEVGEHLSRLTGTPAFEPSQLGSSLANSNIRLSMNPLTRVVPEGDPILQERGALIKRVGNGPLYLVVSEV
jgi:GntR family transcriptional regulator, transcriptional repressor for pyruvate dehydrogenase complex